MFSSWRLFSATTRSMGTLAIQITTSSFRAEIWSSGMTWIWAASSWEVCFWLFLTPRVVFQGPHAGQAIDTDFHLPSPENPSKQNSASQLPGQDHPWPPRTRASAIPLLPFQISSLTGLSSLFCYLLVSFQKSWKIFCPAFLSGALDQITQLSFPGVEVLPSCSFIYDFKKSEVDLALLGHSNASSSLFTPSFSEIIKNTFFFLLKCSTALLPPHSQLGLPVWITLKNEKANEENGPISPSLVSSVALLMCSSCTVDEISEPPPGPGGLVIPLCPLSNFLLSLYSFHVSPFFFFYYIIVETCQPHI